LSVYQWTNKKSNKIPLVFRIIISLLRLFWNIIAKRFCIKKDARKGTKFGVKSEIYIARITEAFNAGDKLLGSKNN